MNKYVIDVEGDNLLKGITKIHCLSYQNIENEDVISITSYNEMREFLSQPMIIVGHNFPRYDHPALEKILEITIPWRIIDTLALSWYLEPERNRHGLSSYGEQFDLLKVAVDDWQQGSVDLYIQRCEQDVRINMKLWKGQYRHLINLYETEEKLNRFLAYIQFKMGCIREQEDVGIKLDVKHCESMLSMLEKAKEDKIGELTEAMPKRALIDVKNRPKIMEKKDGTLSSHGLKWVEFLEEKGIENNPESVEYIRDYELGNPNSHDQLKKWLFGIGWEPQHIKHVRDKKTNITKKIPQIASKEGGGEVCDSVKLLFEKEPKLELLSGLTILSHRIGLFSGFLRDQEEGRLYPTISGLTNTLRMQHSVIVNLPGPGKKYGEEVRASLIADEGCTLYGADLSSLEDMTKRHYMYKYDPEYVNSMSDPSFDPHLDLAILADLMTEEEANKYKELAGRIEKGEKLNKKDKEEYKRLKEVRFKAKTANYSLTYKSGVEALARNSNWKLMVARRVHIAYWRRNKAILDIENDCIIQEIGARKWLQNPISGFWHMLRSDKDKFSTLNQSTGAYIFDLWLTYARREGLIVACQYHDEKFGNTQNPEETREIILSALEAVNNKLQLNVELSCNVQFGQNYSLIH